MVSYQLLRLVVELQLSNRSAWSNATEKGKAVKPFLSDKIVLTERITVTDNGEVLRTGQDTANVLNTFLSNIITNLKIPEYADYDPIVNNTSDPSILSIGEVCSESHKFSFLFSQVGEKDVLEEIQTLDSDWT